MDWLEEHYHESTLKIEEMVAQSNLGRTSYYNQLKSLTDMSPKEFISDFRLKKAAMFLENTNEPISEVAYKYGFNDPVYFTKLFKTKMNMTPSKYLEQKKKNNKNLQESD